MPVKRTNRGAGNVIAAEPSFGLILPPRRRVVRQAPQADQRSARLRPSWTDGWPATYGASHGSHSGKRPTTPSTHSLERSLTQPVRIRGAEKGLSGERPPDRCSTAMRTGQTARLVWPAGERLPTATLRSPITTVASIDLLRQPHPKPATSPFGLDRPVRVAKGWQYGAWITASGTGTTRPQGRA